MSKIHDPRLFSCDGCVGCAGLYTPTKYGCRYYISAYKDACEAIKARKRPNIYKYTSANDWP